MTEHTHPFTRYEGAGTFTHRPLLEGVGYRFTFPNGFGASVIRREGSYGSALGLWELAVLDSTGRLTYDTPITPDVEGHLNETDVALLLDAIEAL